MLMNRDIYLEKLEKFIDVPVIKVITGVRRSGKSKLMEILLKELRSRNINDEQLIYINFEDVKYDSLREYMSLHKNIEEKTLDLSKTTYVLIDEIQNCSQWERAIVSLLSRGNYDIYVTGSNANLLSGELATHLGGRYVELKVYPLAFDEFKSFYHDQRENSKVFNDYLRYGGFPALSLLPDDEESKMQYLNAIVDSIVLKDVVNRNNIRDVELLNRVMLYVFENIGQTFSSLSVSKYLKSIGIKTSPEAVSKYIKYLEDAMIVLSAKRFDVKGKKVMQKLNKYFIADLGVRNALLGFRITDIGQYLENIVYIELLRRGYEVYIGKEGDYEIDFVCMKSGERVYIQVAYILADEKVIEREYRSLEKINDSYPKFVITMDQMLSTSRNGIKHISIIDFLTKKDILM